MEKHPNRPDLSQGKPEGMSEYEYLDRLLEEELRNNHHKFESLAEKLTREEMEEEKRNQLHRAAQIRKAAEAAETNGISEVVEFKLSGEESRRLRKDTFDPSAVVTDEPDGTRTWNLKAAEQAATAKVPVQEKPHRWNREASEAAAKKAAELDAQQTRKWKAEEANASKESNDSDILPLAQTRAAESQKKQKKSKRKRIILAVLAILLALAVLIGSFVWSKLDLINTDDVYSGTETMENDIDADTIDSITDAAGLQDLLKKWATNGGDLMSSKYVENILLLGVDSASNLSDTMMLISVNRRTEQLNMVSFYRDSYTYIEKENGDSAFAKLNAAYSYGGPELVCQTLENNYKIEIDNYIMVDYDSFPKVIDALGGVTVEVSETEAAYLNRTWKNWTQTGNQISFTAGNMKMDGEHALMFARIRKLDSDIERTRRQRAVINAVIESFKDASLTTLNSALNSFFPYLTTNIGKGEMVNYLRKAVSEGWMSFPQESVHMPTDDTCLPGYAGTQWIWICDFEGAAYQLQMLLYGESNISLSEDRVSALDFAQGETSATTQQSTGGYSHASIPTRNYSTSTTTSHSTTGDATYEPVVEEPSSTTQNATEDSGNEGDVEELV